MPKKIVIDAGHYAGYNKSPAYQSYCEGDMVWTLYQLLKQELETYGFIVEGTRGNVSKDIPVYDRGMKAAGADFFISLHSNACGTESVRRVVTIPQIKGSASAYKLANALGDAVTEIMGIHDNKQIYTRPLTDAKGESRDYYGVLRGAAAAGCMTALIVEHSFHTNVASAMWLSKTENLKRLAICEAKTISDILGGNKVEQPVKNVGYSVGDKYTVKEGDKYSTGSPVAKFCIGRKMTIKRVLPGRILLEEINSWIMI